MITEVKYTRKGSCFTVMGLSRSKPSWPTCGFYQPTGGEEMSTINSEPHKQDICSYRPVVCQKVFGGRWSKPHLGGSQRGEVRRRHGHRQCPFWRWAQPQDQVPGQCGVHIRPFASSVISPGRVKSWLDWRGQSHQRLFLVSEISLFLMSVVRWHV